MRVTSEDEGSGLRGFELRGKKTTKYVLYMVTVYTQAHKKRCPIGEPVILCVRVCINGEREASRGSE